MPQYFVWSIKANDNCKAKYHKNKVENIPQEDNRMNSENDVKVDSVWEVVKEAHELKLHSGNIEKYEITYIRRNDGFYLQAIGLSRELQEEFLVKGNFGEFKFRAWRTEQREPRGSEVYVESGGYPYVITDTYIIYTNWSGMDKKAKELCLTYSKDIEAALLHYPVEIPFYKNMPVHNVVFDIGTATKPHYVHAKDMVESGL